MEYFFPANSPRDPLHSPNVSKMVNRRGFDRAVASLDQLRQQGKRIIGGQTDAEQNKMGVAVVMMSENAKGDSGTVMEEEIFGPILPIIPIDVSGKK
jgi:acyl-CoA reductase-like NAD-dependent aldehyde dehydrogenase